ncbi:protein-L-isoaspartate O-methyltransferase [Coraliomargarita sinensis]|uniref:Protein-L-isoaspartate O-methyltransferase n=1 Tax=Coraliomargarita sinensis TaxID=2174842 RepID=A0A317ZF59_9BACT|nr:protein-L-isoaspartate(D-aspartate) O-methyltransferase [Coraliomargarita sinensis]PXA03482.1 protein-L-isoaspartate O-methyltransferase [Coraliomargarita sinensis]
MPESDRQSMVEQVRAMGIRDRRVLKAMGRVRRHLFIPDKFRRGDSYGNHPLPIGYDQTISQPYIVAYMTEKMNVRPGEKILEIGTGSGYQAAILAELGAQVYSVETIRGLAEHASAVLKEEGYHSVKVRHGNGNQGWAEHAPYDVILVTCAPATVPEALTGQLREGGRMILPVGGYRQHLVILRKSKGKIEQQDDLPVRFVPMV